MDIVDMLRALGTQGVGLLEAVRGMPREEIKALGVPGSTAGRWLSLAETFFGPTRSKRLQREAVEAARTGGLSVDALVVIDKNARALLDGDEWALRRELCELRGTVDEIARAAADIVRERNRLLDDLDARAFGRRSVKGGKNTDARGCRTLTITGPERDIANLRASWEKVARKLRSDDPTLTYEQAMYDAMMSGGRASVTLTPHVVVALPDWAKLLHADGDDCVFALTDGTTITGAELLRRITSDFHLVSLYDPVEGPVNLYRSRRQSNDKQRMMLSAESILCEWEGCTTPADESHDHHVVAWSHGGDTNLRNLAKLCRLHNSMNDDHPNAPPRHGRVERDGAGVTLRRPNGTTSVNTHPIRRMSGRALAARQ